jgi:hypothetical protein
MAIERVVKCDFDGELVPLADRRRVAVRRDEDRPESAEYVDVCVPCRKRPLSDLIDFAEAQRPKQDGETLTEWTERKAAERGAPA